MIDWSQTPARQPPEGISSNLVNPSGSGYWQTSTNIVCSVFVVLFVALRLYTRIRLVKNVGWDDCLCNTNRRAGEAILTCFADLIVLAACLFFIDVGLFQYMVGKGLGKHLWDVSMLDFSPCFLRSWAFAAVCYSATMLCIKMSILMLYRRLFPINNFRIQWWATVLLSVGYSVGAMFSSLLACVPIESNWCVELNCRF